VRIAGANVGVVKDVTVTNETEPARADGSPDLGKAAVVMQIDDAGFQDFREDALGPDPPAVAARREIRRVQAHRAASARVARAPAARGDRRRRAGRG
jgi:hypothetical protein